MEGKNKAIWSGVSFGVTSAVITTLGLIIGLYAGTGSVSIILAGLLTIAIADSFSDALGVHLSQESNNLNSDADIWRATISAFISKFFFALTFIPPFLFLTLKLALVVAILWGMFLIGLLSFKIAQRSGQKVYKVVLEHYFIAIVVLFLSDLAGRFIRYYFN